MRREECITIWLTDHRFNQNVLRSVKSGFQRLGQKFQIRDVRYFSRHSDPGPSLSYGVLRGSGDVYRECEKRGTPWWNVDRGFFAPSHYTGYYRLGYRHLQPLFRPGIVCSDSRWKSLGIQEQEWKPDDPTLPILVCPPEGICDFYKLNCEQWIEATVRRLPEEVRRDGGVKVRKRTDTQPLASALASSRLVITHSSNVALQALVSGVPAIADTGLVRSWNNFSFEEAQEALQQIPLMNRSELLHQAAWRQFTLEEFETGEAWEASEEFFDA